MAIKSGQSIIKILAGSNQLRHRAIVPGTVTVDGQPLDENIFTVNYAGSTISRVAPETATKDLHTVAYDHDDLSADRLLITSDKAQLQVDPTGVEVATITMQLQDDEDNNQLVSKDVDIVIQQQDSSSVYKQSYTLDSNGQATQQISASVLGDITVRANEIYPGVDFGNELVIEVIA
jgi:hypothetical protein